MSNNIGRIWWNADNLAEAQQWKADFEAKGAISVEIKPETDRAVVNVIITLERSRAPEILGTVPDAEEWLTEEDPVSKASEGPYAQEATMSSDRRHIRYITDDDGNVIADVRYVPGTDPDEALLNASLLAASFNMRELLQELLAEVQQGRIIVPEATKVQIYKVVTEATTINGN